MKKSTKTITLQALEAKLAATSATIESLEFRASDEHYNPAMDEIRSHLSNMREYKEVLVDYINHRKQQLVLARL